MKKDKKAKTVIGTFDSTTKAQAALDRLLAGGILRSEISLFVAEEHHGTHFAVEKHHKVPEGAALGGVIGGTLGAVAAGLAAVASITIPGIGVLATGPLIAALAGAGVGAPTGGLIGGLIGLGFDEHEAKLVQEGLLDGHIVIGVQTDEERADMVERAFKEHNATSIAA
jgi:hypothetical protein